MKRALLAVGWSRSHGGRLAGPVMAEERRDLSLVEVDAQAVHRHLVAAPVHLTQAL